MSVVFCANDAFKPLKSLLIHSSHIFLGRPLGLLPGSIVLYASGSMCSRWRHQHRRSSLITFFVLHRPILLLNSSDGTLSVSFVESLHRFIIKSFWWKTGDILLCCSARFAGIQQDTTHTGAVGITMRFQWKSTASNSWHHSHKLLLSRSYSVSCNVETLLGYTSKHVCDIHDNNRE